MNFSISNAGTLSRNESASYLGRNGRRLLLTILEGKMYTDRESPEHWTRLETAWVNTSSIRCKFSPTSSGMKCNPQRACPNIRISIPALPKELDLRGRELHLDISQSLSCRFTWLIDNNSWYPWHGWARYELLAQAAKHDASCSPVVMMYFQPRKRRSYFQAQSRALCKPLSVVSRHQKGL